MNAPKVINNGVYRGKPGFTFYVDPSSGIFVLKDPSGNYLTGWQLKAQRLAELLQTGILKN